MYEKPSQDPALSAAEILLMRSLEEALSPEERLQLEQALETKPKLRSAQKALQETILRLEGMPTSSLDRALWSAVQSEIQTQREDQAVPMASALSGPTLGVLFTLAGTLRLFALWSDQYSLVPSLLMIAVVCAVFGFARANPFALIETLPTARAETNNTNKKELRVI